MLGPAFSIARDGRRRGEVCNSSGELRSRCTGSSLGSPVLPASLSLFPQLLRRESLVDSEGSSAGEGGAEIASPAALPAKSIAEVAEFEYRWRYLSGFSIPWREKMAR